MVDLLGRAVMISQPYPHIQLVGWMTICITGLGISVAAHTAGRFMGRTWGGPTNVQPSVQYVVGSPRLVDGVGMTCFAMCLICGAALPVLVSDDQPLAFIAVFSPFGSILASYFALQGLER